MITVRKLEFGNIILNQEKFRSTPYIGMVKKIPLYIGTEQGK